MNKRTNKRNSNMELLRIVAMLMIISYHLFFHCINGQLTDIDSIQSLGNDYFCHPIFYKKLWLLALISPLGQVGNAIFILISGYFMATKESIDLSKISKKLLLQLGFSVLVLGLLSIYAFSNLDEYSVKLVSFNGFNWMSWFVGYYFVVIVIAKLFLNKFLSSLQPKNYVMFMITLFALVQFGWSTSLISNFAAGLETVCIGIFLYSLGGYIRKYNPFALIKTWAIFLIIIAINLLVIGNFYISTASNILNYDQNSGNLFIQNIPGYGNNQIIPVFFGIAMFELFRRIKISSNSVLNFIGSSTFMVYFIHDNDLFYSIWNIQDWITLFHDNVYRFIGKYILYVLLIFAIGLLCYIVFLLLSKLLELLKPCLLKTK